MTKLSFDWSYEGAQRLAALEDELGEIGGGGSAIGGWAQANRRHSEAIAALHAFGEALGMIADHAVFSVLSRASSPATIRLHRWHDDYRESITVRIDHCAHPLALCEVWLRDPIARVPSHVAQAVALRALRAAVDARLAGADWPAVVEAARAAAEGER